MFVAAPCALFNAYVNEIIALFGALNWIGMHVSTLLRTANYGVPVLHGNKPWRYIIEELYAAHPTI